MQKYNLTHDVVLSHIQSSKYYFEDQLTICVITTTSGDKVVGKSLVFDMQKYDKQIGMEEAYKDAIDELYSKCAFLLKVLNKSE